MKAYVTAVRLVLLSAVCGWVTATGEEKMKIHYLDDECNRVVKIGNMARVMLSEHPYLSYMNCTVTFRARKYTSSTQLMVRFRDINIMGSINCRLDKLEIFDGPSTNSPMLTKHAICSSDKLDGMYTTKPVVTLFFINSGLRSKLAKIPHFHKDLSGFDMIITSYHKGPCSDGFGCVNGRCISKQLMCNGYNNCGDNSDEAHCGLTTLGLAALGMVGTMGIVLIVSGTALCVKRRSRQVAYAPIN